MKKIALALTMSACFTPVQAEDFYGTLHPFAKENVYFVVTDRFVDGDKSNNFENDSGFDQPINWPTGEQANVGYLGGDFRGLLDQAQYIKDLGFTSIWMTPIIQNPAEAFTGGYEIKPTGFAMDRGKSGYHGYWGVNFYQLDKHLPSKNLDYKQLNEEFAKHDIKTILDVVINHGSPAYTMPTIQPEFGKLYDKSGKLVADHMNLSPERLQPETERMHSWFYTKPDLAQLADINVENDEALNYFVGAYLQWLGEGASAFRIDTVKHVPAEVWGKFTQKIRAHYPNLFMFGEAYSYDANDIARYTYPKFGGMSVLDFPLKKALDEVFASGKGFEHLNEALHLVNGPYANPYMLTTFYDNHDMARMNATDHGFIDAHNWLFTARGIPVVYYGSEIGFERGKGEHFGNRNYYGIDNIAKAKNNKITEHLAKIAKVRKENIALQKGLQIPVELSNDKAMFYRIYQYQGVNQTALVLLNKGESSQEFKLPNNLPAGKWVEALEGTQKELNSSKSIRLNPHSVKVFLLNQEVTSPDLLKALRNSMAHRLGRL
ncbi:cyclomaltodextrin glucanotransferase [Shewanella sp. 202IG2-18]|uniref:alpha-amylase family glycosyl hydrolase n=1 Tax=Parashewanella hymeniacidonis TaxID=2807618 RepID=UPI00195FEE81|nr:alpha-amylase family glycosyl hydrolase [Parashewanella hymeniacidonis]MBM7073619.1 cyclomaltodextrin glucanotransferase [Parashewanella hymeniacidonis]